jgi:hypothetical protein
MGCGLDAASQEPVKVYAFDVDYTLNLSGGPVTVKDVGALREQGNVVGLCGNWAAVTMRWQDWYRTFSFLGPLSLTKPEFLQQIRRYVIAEEYVMVGNDVVRGSSPNDAAAAKEAGWRFIKESDFAAGQR